MKNIPPKLLILIFGAIAFSILIICAIIYLVFFNKPNSRDITSIQTIKNTVETEKLVTFSQKDLFVTAFVTEEPNSMRTVHILYKPSIIFNIDSGFVKAVRILNFNMTSAKGEGLFIAVPPTAKTVNCFNYVGGPCETLVTLDMLKSGLNNGIYNCNVTQNPTTIADCRNQQSIDPQFYLVQKSAGSFNYDQVYKSASSYNSAKILEYAKLTPSDLNADISFTLQIEFEDGKIWNKKLSAKSDGNRIMNDTFYTLTLDATD